MSFYAVISFDLEGYEWNSYDCIESKLNSIGIGKTIRAKNNYEIDLPRNMFIGKFSRMEFEESSNLCSYLNKEIKRIFEDCYISGAYLISIGDKWLWKRGTVTIDNDY